jgi:Transposase and inactivated derivatives
MYEAHTRVEMPLKNKSMTKTIKEMLDQQKDEIIALYLEEGKTQVQIAEQFGTTPDNIFKFMNRHSIKKQRIRKTAIPKTSVVKAIGKKFNVKIYRDPKTHGYYIKELQGQGFQVRTYISSMLNAGYTSTIYIIPEEFESNFSQITTKNNLIYPDTKD